MCIAKYVNVNRDVQYATSSTEQSRAPPVSRYRYQMKARDELANEKIEIPKNYQLAALMQQSVGSEAPRRRPRVSRQPALRAFLTRVSQLPTCYHGS
jgi:hypothetical protein